MTGVVVEVPDEAHDPDCLDVGEAAALLAGAPWRSMVVVGDSVAAGVREPLAGYLDAGFADRVGDTLAAARPGFRYLNLGARDLRLHEIIAGQLEAAIEFRPDLALVVAGGNDALGRRFDERVVRAQLAGLLGALRIAGADVVTVGLFDVARSGLVPAAKAAVLADRFDRLDAVTAETTRSLGGLHVDTHHHPRAADPALYAGDRIHANARGHAIAFAAITRALGAALGRGWPRAASGSVVRAR
jgi:lysophospholipase L1-like esterase